LKSRIYLGDSREVLPRLREELQGKVALVVTSPPYYVSRGYEDYMESWLDYWEVLRTVFDITSNLVEPYGKIAVNFADKYANSKEFKRPLEICYASHYTTMLGMHDLWARIIWWKNRLPDGARHVVHKSRFEGQMRVSPDWEYIFVWRKRGVGKPRIKDLTMDVKSWKAYSKGVWQIDPVRRNPSVKSTKLAIFPDEIPKRLIEMYTSPGDIVLDPFVGSGTTVKVARNLGRVGIGIERNLEMIPILEANLQPTLFGGEVEWN